VPSLPGAPAAGNTEAGRLAALPPASVPQQQVGRVELIRRYVEQYDGGECFFVAPVAISETSASLEGLGASVQPFIGLDEAFKRDIGFEADIGIRQVTSAQCPALTFLGRIPGTRVDAPRLEVDKSSLRGGEILSGSIERVGRRKVELLLVSDSGTVQNISDLLEPGAEPRTFRFPVQQPEALTGSRPQLLLAVASPAPLEALRAAGPMAAERFFAGVLTEAARSGEPLSAAAKYFRLDPPLDGTGPTKLARSLVSLPSDADRAQRFVIELATPPAPELRHAVPSHLELAPFASRTIVPPAAASIDTPTPAAPRSRASVPQDVMTMPLPSLGRSDLPQPAPAHPESAPSNVAAPPPPPASAGRVSGGRLAALPAKPAMPSQPVSRADLIRRYVEQYDGGECFFIAPVAIRDTSAAIEGFGASLQPFNALDEAFKRDNGFEADIGVHQVTSAQCPAVSFLGRVRDGRASAPRLDLSKTSLRGGETFSGVIDRFGSRTLELLLVSEIGSVQSISNLLEPNAGLRTFSFPAPRNDMVGAHPQLLLAIATAAPLETLRPDGPIDADSFFAAVLAEAAQTCQSVAVTASYFRLEPPLEETGPVRVATSASPPAFVEARPALPRAAMRMASAHGPAERWLEQPGRFEPTRATHLPPVPGAAMAGSTALSPNLHLPSSSATPFLASPYSRTAIAPGLSEVSRLPVSSPLAVPATSLRRLTYDSSLSAARHGLESAARPAATGFSDSAPSAAPYPGVAAGKPGSAAPSPQAAAAAPAPMQLLAGRMDPARLAALPRPSSPRAQPVRPDELIRRYVEQYDGGECFFITPVAISGTSAVIEGLGASLQPFDRLDDAFKRDNGFEADIGIRQVTNAQCPAVSFLARLRETRAMAPRLEIDKLNLGSGETLSGSVGRFGSENVELLLVSDDGSVQNISRLLKAGPDSKMFSVAIAQQAGVSGSQPELLLAITSAAPLRALRPDTSVAADEFFRAVLAEAARSGEPLAAAARYFRLEH
jgi:hypothetical protein